MERSYNHHSDQDLNISITQKYPVNTHLPMLSILTSVIIDWFCLFFTSKCVLVCLASFTQHNALLNITFKLSHWKAFHSVYLICPWWDIWVVFSWRLLSIKPPWTLFRKSLSRPIHSFHLGIHLVVELLGQRVGSCLTIKLKLPNSSPKIIFNTEEPSTP